MTGEEGVNIFHLGTESKIFIHSFVLSPQTLKIFTDLYKNKEVLCAFKPSDPIVQPYLFKKLL